MQNELQWHDEPQVHVNLAEIKDAMLDCIHRGCRTNGTLPAALHVQRRAARMARSLLGHDVSECCNIWLNEVKLQSRDFQRILN